ncbi:MAG TPA: ABC transporter ATP-binding protein [Bacilli bacterium]
MSKLLQVENLTGGYGLDRQVLHQLSFTVDSSEMIGLIGLNGAGKSTTIKHILGFMRPHSGHIRLNGRLLDEDAVKYRRTYAYVPESPLLYEELTVHEHLELAAMAYGLDAATAAKREDDLLERFQMSPHRSKLAGQLSKGMKQKVLIMSAFLVRPQLYVIDEPFLGLDPLGIRSLLDLLAQVKREGAGILLSSHILTMIERFCDRFLLLHQGRLIASGNLAELREAAGVDFAESSLDDVFCQLVTRS